MRLVAAENLRVRVAEQALAGRSPDHVVGAVAQDGSDHEQPGQQDRVHAAAGSDCTGDEQQGIAWQEGHHHQAGFAKYDSKQNGIDPGPVIGDQQIKVRIEMQDEVQRVEIHVQHLWSGSKARLPGGVKFHT